jgi:PhnB protein
VPVRPLQHLSALASHASRARAEFHAAHSIASRAHGKGSLRPFAKRRRMQLEPYIFFYGRCEEALNFYKDVFNGEITGLTRIQGSPMEAHAKPDEMNNVMHATFKAGDFTFMASDGRPSTNEGEGNISLSLATSDEAEAKRVFAKLCEGGNVSTPFEEVFWGGKFGSVTDKFGVEWMVSAR